MSANDGKRERAHEGIGGSLAECTSSPSSSRGQTSVDNSNVAVALSPMPAFAEHTEHTGRTEQGGSARTVRAYESSRAGVAEFYREQHAKQTLSFARAMLDKYSAPRFEPMGAWQTLELLDRFVDSSDPDTENSQLQHALQTAEALRAAFPATEMDWFPLVGLVHDLGKMLAAKGGEPQWAVVGDTFPLGCRFDPANIFHADFAANPDAKNPDYATADGVYSPGCGFDAVTFSFGHDEYLYRVLKRSECRLPDIALYLVRYHSFYPWHARGAYAHLAGDTDRANLAILKEFQRFDLYSKSRPRVDPAALRPHYLALIDKYLPHPLRW